MSTPASAPAPAPALAGAGTLAAAASTSSYDPATQSHWGACSRNTTNASQAVGDLSANGVLGQYAVLVGVHATGRTLLTDMRHVLTVVHVARVTTTANHGCTTDGVIFPTGARTLTAGETVGAVLPASVRSRLCAGPGAGCKRIVVPLHTVFPTNCWNLDQGNVSVVVYEHVKAKKKALVARPSARVSTTCGVGNPGYATVTLSNRRGASGRATFVVDGKRYGPVAAGKSLTVTVGLQDGRSVRIRASSGGQALVDQSVPADQCAVTPTVEAAASANAALSCSAGGVVVTLANGTSATADASYEVNGTAYGPLAPGGSESVVVPVGPGTTGTVAVTSGGRSLLTVSSFTNPCAAGPAASASIACAPPSGGNPFPPGGGVVVVQLSDGATATLPASFTVTATGNTTAGFGPTTVGPVAVGATQTLLIPVDASGNDVTVTVASGGQTLGAPQTFTGGCLGFNGAE